MAVTSGRDLDVINVVVLGVIAWTLAFISLRKLLPKRSFEFCNRLVSTLHACLAVTLASISVQNWRCPICPLASQASPFQVLSSSKLCTTSFCCSWWIRYEMGVFFKPLKMVDLFARCKHWLWPVLIWSMIWCVATLTRKWMWTMPSITWFALLELQLALLIKRYSFFSITKLGSVSTIYASKKKRSLLFLARVS